MKQKVLIVEDQPIILRVIENQLVKAGFDVVCCSNGKEAQDCFDEQQFNTVLTDLLMPQACGLELLHHIRNVKKSDTPVVVVSDIYMDEKVKEAYGIGASHYMRKPFDMGELVETLKFFRNAS
jgi:DNA-binding response OmpR family regulator